MNSKIYNILRPKSTKEMYETNKWVLGIEKMDPEELAASSYMLTGPRGSGKTTTARIIANRIGSKSPLEMNAAEERGINEIRDLKARMKLTPIFDARMAIILDEAGELTDQAQKALLKELEDCPKHVCIILSTTDEDRIIPTIRDRCITIPMRPLTEEDSAGFTTYISKIIQSRIKEAEKGSEGWIKAALEGMLNKINKENIKNIIERSNGSIRSTINGLYTFSVTGELPEYIGIDSTVEDIMQLLTKKEYKDIVRIISRMAPTDIRKLHRALGARMLRTATNQKETFFQFKLINEFMKPIEYGCESTVVIARLIETSYRWTRNSAYKE